MSKLDQAHDQLKDLVKRHLDVNAILEEVEALPEYTKMIDDFHMAFKNQISKLLKSGLFADIDSALHPVTKAKSEPKRIHTESDYLEIQDAVDNNIKPLKDDKKLQDMFADFLILIFNKGGQDFLNKHNIPATFDVTNPTVVSKINDTAKKTIDDLDDTTQKWVTDQISAGRQAGLSNADIADQITEKVPQTYLNRSERIVRTETSNMVGEAEQTTAVNNGASHKEWVTVAGACPICEMNEQAGQIGISEIFPSGDSQEPAHPNCRCIVEYVFTPFMGTVWSGQ